MAGACGAVAVALAGVIPSAWTASAAPGSDCTGAPISQTLVGGSPLEVLGQSPAAHHFGASFDGMTRSADTQYFTPHFPTPRVGTVTQFRLLISCEGADGAVAWQYTIVLLPSAPGGVTRAPSTDEADMRTRPSVALLVAAAVVIPALLVLAWMVNQRERRPRSS